jgi:hypothetical protein
MLLILAKSLFMEGYYTLITGGSSGIGRSLAFECARRKMNLILVSRPSDRLSGTAGEIASQYPDLDIKYFAVDLTKSDSASMVYEWCKKQDLKVNFIINNAGITGTFQFEDASPDYLSGMITLNTLTLVMLIHYFLPDLRKYSDPKILNVGSMSGFFPIPFKGVYAATKAFLYSFSRSLEAELKESGVKLFHSSPNGITSNPLTSKRIKDHKRIGKIVSMTTEDYSALTLSMVEKGKSFQIPLFSNRLLFAISRIIPDSLIVRVLKKEFSREFESVSRSDG